MDQPHKQQSHKQHKLVKITEDELDDLLSTAKKVCSGISGKRVRRQAKNPDADYFDAVASQQLHAGITGGLVAGSGHHYERSYRN